MTTPLPDLPFALRLPTAVAARIRATAPVVGPPRRRRPAPKVWHVDDREVD